MLGIKIADKFKDMEKRIAELEKGDPYHRPLNHPPEVKDEAIKAQKEMSDAIGNELAELRFKPSPEVKDENPIQRAYDEGFADEKRDKPSDVKTEQTLEDKIRDIIDWNTTVRDEDTVTLNGCRWTLGNLILEAIRSHKSTDKVEIPRDVAEEWSKYILVKGFSSTTCQDAALFSAIRKALDKQV